MIAAHRSTPTRIEPYLTADDLAAVLGITTKALYHRRRRGQIPPAIVLGSALRWDPADVRDWLDALREPTRDAETDPEGPAPVCASPVATEGHAWEA